MPGEKWSYKPNILFYFIDEKKVFCQYRIDNDNLYFNEIKY